MSKIYVNNYYVKKSDNLNQRSDIAIKKNSFKKTHATPSKSDVERAYNTLINSLNSNVGELSNKILREGSNYNGHAHNDTLGKISEFIRYSGQLPKEFNINQLSLYFNLPVWKTFELSKHQDVASRQWINLTSMIIRITKLIVSINEQEQEKAQIEVIHNQLRIFCSECKKFMDEYEPKPK